MRNRNWLIIGLIVSVGANLALAGFVAGQMSRHDRPASMDPSFGLFRVLRELPDARRDEFRPTMREHFRGLRGDLRRMGVAQRGIDEALAREPFAPEALAEALAAFRAALLDSQQSNHEVLVKVAASMTPAERELMVDAMKRPRAIYRRRSRDEGHGLHRRDDPEDDGAHHRRDVDDAP
jgi:uncharacterized membrane protein